ncbi:hypothetical protein RI129_003004 [Pyrocoelia pectoralis]|uniref:Uncharacterized protein n=1 Tax=Pyrocoelia pectoralis TaxID=417401 RepID=A0AAN7ZMP5_9COLE
MLICMLSDSRPHIRELAIRRILNAKKRENSEIIRPFIIPRLNFEADDYTNLIDWQNNDITPPPLLQYFELDELRSIIKETPNKVIEITSYPCHTQAVERCVKLVTEASLSIVGFKKRDGFIKARLDSRKLMPQFESKKDFLQ